MSDINILLVDDKPDKLLALEVVLADLQVNLVRATSGREALRYLLKEEFAVILLDVNMPAMDGFETASMVRQRRSSRDTPIIFITAFADEMHMARGYSLGAVDYILAPVIPDVLRTKVRVLVDLFRQRRQLEAQALVLQRRAGQLQKLAAASLAINSARSLASLMRIVVDSARDAIGAHQAVILLLPGVAGSEQRGEAVASVSNKFDEAPLRSPQLDAIFNTSIAGAKHAVRLTKSEFRAHPDFGAFTGGNLREVNGLLAAPMTASTRELGIIYLSDRVIGDFTEDDQAILTQFAQMASIAIENALYAEERDANRLKEEFLATLSHELRTPLNAILGWTQLLRSGPSSEGELSHAFEVIERNVRAQSRLIEDLLDASRISSGKMRLSPRPTEFAEIVEGAVESAGPAAAAKRIKLRTEISTDVGEVVGDPDRLQQVIWNLLSNAIKFTPPEGEVAIGARRTPDGGVIVHVRDSGRGISEGFLPHVFDRFRQADSSTTRSHGGLGLGLAIVRHIVELHGGSVHADSAGEGKGATFTFELPQSPPESLDSRLENQASTPVTPAVPHHVEYDLDGLNVLAVDDKADARELLLNVLSRSKANVRVAGSAREALKMFDEQPPDVLVSDIGMPEDDGYTLILAVRCRDPQHGGNAPAVALTAYVGDDDRARMLAAGFTAHVAKPVEPAELVRIIHSISGRAFQPA
jgi:signal transduction histidine kinase